MFQKQKDDSVYYKEKTISLNTPIGRAEFMHVLYNVLHDKEAIDDARTHTDALNGMVSKMYLKSYHQDRTHEGRRKKCARTGDHSNASAGAGGRAGGASATECAELGAHGYNVIPEVIVRADGIELEPLFEMPPHILTVYQPSDPRTKLIAKKAHEQTNELAIFNLLNSIQPKSDHVVLLLDSFHTQSATWLILPKLASVADYVVGLIEGLAYLHKHCIAHRDIKPDNLLVDQDFCVKIIDFDVAMQVTGEGEEVNDQCGTKHWMAPEIGKSMHSPIKADRWSLRDPNQQPMPRDISGCGLNPLPTPALRRRHRPIVLGEAKVMLRSNVQRKAWPIEDSDAISYGEQGECNGNVQAKGQPLLDSGALTERKLDLCFRHGFHPRDRRMLQSHLKDESPDRLYYSGKSPLKAKG
ncbi:kinase-like domain-containing protein [Russula earlei]|uniref:Kinase-like domain-containing protein n=1 Tax=Russula earlei TaxID=71964 RepID=A0ACC0U4M1_9AGAM|nr:kinase-like domain-containing protein [Russula earlei]